MVTGREGVKMMVEMKRMSQNVDHVAGISDVPSSMSKPLCFFTPSQCVAGTITLYLYRLQHNRDLLSVLLDLQALSSHN